ncbi:MAG: PQQ-like beta-propeller repeat protein [Thermoanaerobaculia bacterium]|nr:PQQ-like beta-propeller repeat protein [Thermoanaerobaculia bacterium]
MTPAHSTYRVPSAARLGVWIASLALVLSTVAFASGTESGSDWPQFRGIERNGISPETGLLDSWPDSGPPEVWRRELGEGYSGITVVGNKVYTMYADEVAGEGGEAEAREFAASFDRNTGEEHWRVDMGAKLDTEFGNGPRSTPTVAGDTVFVLGSHGRLAALSTEDGGVKWQKEFTADFGAERPYWGFSTSALVDGGRLIIEAGGSDGRTLVALNPADGELIWSLGESGAGYNSPLRVDRNGEIRYVHVSGGKLFCVDTDGNEVWSHEWPQGETHAMPILAGPGLIYASGAEGVGAQLVKVAEDESEVEKVWDNRLLRNHFSSAVVQDGVIYGFDNATLKAVSVEDSSLIWAKRGLGKGSLMLADGHLIVLSDRGKLVLVATGTDKYSEISSFQAMNDLSWTAPTVSHGRLFIRNHQEMVSFDLRQKGDS